MKTKTIFPKIIVILLVSGLLSGCIIEEQQPQEEDAFNKIPTGDMTITSAAFNNSEPIPALYARNMGNIPPPLNFSNIPDDAKSLALIMDDPDAPEETWIHWTVWNIPATKSVLPEYGDIIYPMGTNSWEKTGYDGPAPPSGATHHYYFRLYALNSSLNLDIGTYAEQLKNEIAKYGIEKAELMGTYSG